MYEYKRTEKEAHIQYPGCIRERKTHCEVCKVIVRDTETQ